MKISKPAIGTIAAVLAIGAVGYRGSSARVFSDSKKMKKRFHDLNGFHFDELVDMITERLLSISLQIDLFKEIENPTESRYPPMESETWEWDTPLPAPVTIDDGSPRYQLINLAGVSTWVSTEVERIHHSGSEAGENAFKEKLETFLETNESGYALALDIFGKMELYGWDNVQILRCPIYVPDKYLKQYGNGMLRDDHKNLNAFFPYVRSMIQHELFHAIDPLARRVQPGKMPYKHYWTSKAQRPTQGADIAMEVHDVYKRSGEESKNRISRAVEEGDLATLLLLSIKLRTAFGDYDMNRLLTEVRLGTTITKREYYARARKLLEADPLFRSFSVKKWLKMVRTYFGDRGLLPAGSPNRHKKFIVKSPKKGLEVIQHKDITENWQKSLRVRPKSSTAVLVPCAATKPFPEAPSHKHGYLRALEGKDVDVYIVSEPLGIVPYSWSGKYPNDSYDFPPEHLKGEARQLLSERIGKWFDRVYPKYQKVYAALPGHHMKLVRDSTDAPLIDASIADYRQKSGNDQIFRAATNEYVSYLKRRVR